MIMTLLCPVTYFSQLCIWYQVDREPHSGHRYGI